MYSAENYSEIEMYQDDQKIESHVLLKYEIECKLGSGAYGHVWRARSKLSGGLCAIKKVFLAFDNPTDAQRIYREVSILKNLNHPTIVQLLDVLPAENQLDIYLIFELLESDLFTAIRDRVLNSLHKKYIVYQLAVTIKYLHATGIIHRDLKPSNVLLSKSSQIKVCDFGLARTLKSEHFESPIMTEFISTRWYRAPEVLFGSKTYTTHSDMWSLGCLIYELYTRKTLLAGESTVDQIEKLLAFKGYPTLVEQMSLDAPNTAEVLKMFKIATNPIQDYFQAIEDPALIELLTHLLHYNPTKRWSAEQILHSDFLVQFRNFEAEVETTVPMLLPLNDNLQLSSEEYREAIHTGVIQNDSIAKNSLSPVSVNRIPINGQSSSLHLTKYKRRFVLNRSIEVTKRVGQSVHSNSLQFKTNKEGRTVRRSVLKAKIKPPKIFPIKEQVPRYRRVAHF